MAYAGSKSSGYKMGCFADKTGLFWHRFVGVDKHDYRRKFRSQTRPYGQMKSRDGKSRRDGKSHGREEEEEGESHRRKKIQVRGRVGKSRSTVFLHWFVAPEGRKVGSLKRRERSPLGRWEMKNCTTLWREAHFGVNMFKKNTRSDHWSWDVEKVHAVVARSTFRSQNVKKKTCSDHWSWDVEKVHAVVTRSTFLSQKCKQVTGSEHFWKLRCRKSAHRRGAKHISKSKC